jgi:aryl-alcohol dehydrogenase-like predicted oxidoreductase
VEFRQLGLAGVRVSEVGLGTNQFGSRLDERGVAAVINKALELGVNFIDTAESYSDGNSEQLIGRAVAGRRDQFVIATKTGSKYVEPLGRLSRRQIVSRLDASLKRLGTDYVDLYYLHFPDPGTPLEESLRALDDMVRSGKVLYPALSNHPAWQIAEALAICDRERFAKPVVTQNEYNLLLRTAEAELLPACQHFGLSLVPYSPLAAGFLTGKYRRNAPVPSGVRGHENRFFQEAWVNDANFDALEYLEGVAKNHGRPITDLAMAWLLAQPLVCSVIAGMTSPEQLESNVRAAEWRLSPEDLKGL